MSDIVIRLGIRRPASASPHPVVAVAEARVLHDEFSRRLGPVVLDLRTETAPFGPWKPFATAAWPAAIDAELDVATLWGPETVPLTALFGRTVDDLAADTRARMLRHLGVLGEDRAERAVFDDAVLARLGGANARPTDVWIVARSADRIALDDDRASAAIAAFVESPGSPRVAALDSEIDRIIATMPDRRALDAASTATVQRLDAQLRHASAALSALRDDSARVQRELLERIEALTHERAVLLERIERAELARADA